MKQGQEPQVASLYNKCLHGFIYFVCALIIAAAFAMANAINFLA